MSELLMLLPFHDLHGRPAEYGVLGVTNGERQDYETRLGSLPCVTCQL